MPDAFKCLKSNGYEFAIIRAFESVGRPDSNAPHTIYNAWDGGALFDCHAPQGQGG